MNAVMHRRHGLLQPAAVGDLPAPLAWYRADDLALLDDAPVTAWPDASGNGHDLIEDGTPGSAWAYPTFQTNALNGLPGVQFLNRPSGSGTSSITLATELGGLAIENLTTLIVFTRSAANMSSNFMPAYLFTDSSGTGSGEIQHIVAQTQARLYAAVDDGTDYHEADASAGAPSFAAYWLLNERLPAGAKVAVNGGLPGSDLTALPEPMISDSLWVGSAGARHLSDVNYDFDYLVHEIELWDAEFTAGQKAAVSAYAAGKWGL